MTVKAKKKASPRRKPAAAKLKGARRPRAAQVQAVQPAADLSLLWGSAMLLVLALFGHLMLNVEMGRGLRAMLVLALGAGLLLEWRIVFRQKAV